MPLHSPLATLQTKQNVKPVKVINEKDRIIIVKTLFKVKLQALAIELAALLNRSFPHTLFPRKFQSKCSSELLCMAGFERLHSKTLMSLQIKRKNLHMLYGMGRLNKKLKRIEENASVGVLL